MKGGLPETFIGALSAVDEESLQICFVEHKTQNLCVITFEDASFGLEDCAVFAERPPGDVLMFVESGS